MRRAAALLIALGACTESGRNPDPAYSVDDVGIELPRLPGWIKDSSVHIDDNAKGGTALRLVIESAVAGSPRIDVVLEELGTRPSRLDTWLARNEREMAALETSGQIHIISVEKNPISVGLRRAYRVRHEYTIGSGTTQVAITQVSTFLVLDGRGVSITAVGRTELFHPMADSIERVLAGIKTKDSKEPPETATPAVPEHGSTPPTPQQPPNVQPVDLGKIGGQ
jgi:hypothetical protein